MGSSATSSPKLFSSLRTCAAAVFALICTRFELISVEFQEEKKRYQQMLLNLVLAAIFLGAALLLIAIFVIVLFWDSYRLFAAASMGLLYCVAGVWALFRLSKVSHQSSAAFSATLHEFKRDQQLFRGHDE